MVITVRGNAMYAPGNEKAIVKWPNATLIEFVHKRTDTIYDADTAAGLTVHEFKTAHDKVLTILEWGHFGNAWPDRISSIDKGEVRSAERGVQAAIGHEAHQAQGVQGIRIAPEIAPCINTPIRKRQERVGGAREDVALKPRVGNPYGIHLEDAPDRHTFEFATGALTNEAPIR